MQKYAVLFLVVAALAVAAPSYDDGVATSAAYYSAAAYCDPLALLTWSCGAACGGNSGVLTVRPVVYADTSSFTYGYVTINVATSTIVVAFRGTNGIPSAADFRSIESFLNWETNLDFKQVNYLNVSGAMVHSGFYESYSSVQNQVRSSVGALLKGFPNSPILVTGHSLGGALATFAALDLKTYFATQLSPSQLSLYTFGAPRPGNPAFADYFSSLFPPLSSPVFRVTHGNDIVPHVPSLVQKFVHIGIEVWYSASSSYRVCGPPAGSIYEDPTCSDGLLTYGIEEHMIYLGLNITNLCPITCPLGTCQGCGVDPSPPSFMRNIVPVIDDNLQLSSSLSSSSSSSLSSNVVIGSGDPICPNCDSYGCNASTGVCKNACVDSRLWWGPTCTNQCMGSCDSYGCRKDNGLCANSCSDSRKWWGPQCSNPCTGHCDSYGCRKDNGLCANSCADARQWWGPQCDFPCGGHCDSYGCRKDNGYCANGCSDKRQWWEPKCCSNPCTGNCDSYGCNTNNGLCANSCSDATKWWGPHCDITCTGHCDSYGCNKDNGVCRNSCSDARKWWGIQCDQTCTGNCDAYGCVKSTGLCSNGCNGKFWGDHCENSCAQCDAYGCNKKTGACNHPSL